MMQRQPKRLPRNYRHSRTERGGHLSQETISFVPREAIIRPLRDQLIIAPIDVLHSRLLVIPPHESKLIRGKVLAAGPGHYPNAYLDKWGNKNPPKGQRTQIVAGTVFVPNPVQVGDIVHVDGRQTGKSAFEAFYYGDVYCIHARAEDVAGVEVSEAREHVGYMPNGDPAFMVYEKP